METADTFCVQSKRPCGGNPGSPRWTITRSFAWTMERQIMHARVFSESVMAPKETLNTFCVRSQETVRSESKETTEATTRSFFPTNSVCVFSESVMAPKETLNTYSVRPQETVRRESRETTKDNHSFVCLDHGETNNARACIFGRLIGPPRRLLIRSASSPGRPCGGNPRRPRKQQFVRLPGRIMHARIDHGRQLVRPIVL